MGKFDEKRTHARHEVALAAKMRVIDSSQPDATVYSAAVQIVNLSLGGMRLQSGRLPAEVAKQLELGKQGVVLRVEAGKQPLELRAQVRWIEASAERSLLGVRYVNVDPQAAQRLFELVEHGRRGGPRRSYAALWRALPWVVGLGLLVCWRYEARLHSSAQQRTAAAQTRVDELQARVDRDRPRQREVTQRLHECLDAREQQRAACEQPQAAAAAAPARSAARQVVRSVSLSNVPFALRIVDGKGAHTAQAQPIRLSYEDGKLAVTLQRTNTAAGSAVAMDLELQAVDPRAKSKAVDAAHTCSRKNLSFNRLQQATFECPIQLWPAGYVQISLRQHTF